VTLPIHEIVNRLASPASRGTEAARIAAEVGAEAFLVLLYDRAIDAFTPAPGFPQTVPGGASWRAFFKGPHRAGPFDTHLPFPSQDEPKLARVLVADGAVFMLIGGEPRIRVEAFAETPLLAALLRAEAEQLASVGLATAAREAMARATNLAAALDNARAEVRRKADELAQALRGADQLNEQLKSLNETLEQRIAERTSERNMLATIVEKTDVLVMACDLNYNILAINNACADDLERVYGIHPQAGDNLLTLLDDQPEQQQQVRAAWARGLAGEEAIVLEEFGDPARERLYYEIKFRNLWDEAGERIGAYQFVTDVTERLRKETQLADAQEALRQSQKMDAIGQLTGGVAHDFNNLLTPIVGALDMLQRKGVGSERDQRLIDGAAQSAERAKTLVQRLLAFARRQPLQPTSVDIAKLVTGMADLIRSTSGPQIRVVLEAGENLPPAKADPNQIEMAVLNLSVNARDAMPQGGTLRITAGDVEVGRDHPAKLRQGRYIRLSVADTGVGMDEATLVRAVEPFFSTKGLGKGTGLGLSMAHGLASQLGGALTVQSRSGVGTNVELWLPVSDEAVESAERIVDSTSMRAAGTALLVDDEELVRSSTAEMLRELGYEVAEAASAEEALRLIGNGLRPDLLVTDHLMPGIDGTDLARMVRSHRPEVQVLIISGYAECEGIAPDLRRLTKPFRSDELQTSLAKLRSEASH
jgi:signal transduction histidine kinase/CheY-like chemotaxis protein